MTILRARAEHADTLSAIALAAKRHWGYPENWILEWRTELTITPSYVAEHPTFAAVVAGELVGFSAVRIVAQEAVLDHLWIMPAFMMRGLGRALFQHAEQVARARGAAHLKIVADPHAEAFYLRMGATLSGHRPASIDGKDRSLPIFEKQL